MNVIECNLKKLILIIVLFLTIILFTPFEKCLADDDSTIDFGHPIMIIIISAVGLIIASVIIYYFVNRKKKKQKETDYEEILTKPLESKTLETKLAVQSIGCAHPQRPAQNQCINCGIGMCFECGFSDRISSVISSTTSMIGTTTSGEMVTGGGFSTSEDYGIFCARCFLNRVNDPEYLIQLTGNRLIKPKLPNFFTLGRPNFLGKLTTIFGFLVLSAFTFGIGIPLIWLPLYMERYREYKEFAEKKQNAEYLLNLARRND